MSFPIFSIFHDDIDNTAFNIILQVFTAWSFAFEVIELLTVDCNDTDFRSRDDI